jgi:predicted dehydrogenase
MSKREATPNNPSRRGILKTTLAAGAAPWFVPASVLGSAGQPAPSARVTVGVIGVGPQGQGDMQNFLSQPDVRVTAICDVNQRNIASARDRIKNAYGSPDAKVITDFRELNADASIDAVLLALPVHWHSVPAQDSILHGKHIYHEKPMGMSFVEAVRVRDAVRKKGVVFQFGTQQRSDLKFRWACELALNGRLGKVTDVHVSVPGGKHGDAIPPQSVPDYIDWDRWVGPAMMTSFNEKKLERDNHENINNFSLGMISCWGIHHLDIAQWGNGTDAPGPSTVQGTGVFPPEGACHTIERGDVRFEFAKAAPVTFVQDGTEGFRHGIKFIGETGWVHVDRGTITAHDDQFLRDPQNKYDTMPIRLPISADHVRNFIDAIKTKTRAICDIETAVHSDTLCQIALIAVKEGRKLRWDPQAEQFIDDASANAMLQPRPFRGPWRLAEA